GPHAGLFVAPFETTQEMYLAVMGDNPSRWVGRLNSVENTSFADAVSFCEKTTTLLRGKKLIAAYQVVRLPTSAEWTTACAAGTKTPYSFGEAAAIDDYCWYTGNAAGNDPPVGAKKPNPWALYDVHGYLWEWCLPDDAKIDPTAPKSKTAPARGGAWTSAAEECRTDAVQQRPIGEKRPDLGFRCVLAKSP
ncbi:MAG: formylglycine-generating enzyme family protein, partial [Planctomycetia bacterium]